MFFVDRLDAVVVVDLVFDVVGNFDDYERGQLAVRFSPKSLHTLNEHRIVSLALDVVGVQHPVFTNGTLGVLFALKDILLGCFTPSLPHPQDRSPTHREPTVALVDDYFHVYLLGLYYSVRLYVV